MSGVAAAGYSCVQLAARFEWLASEGAEPSPVRSTSLHLTAFRCFSSASLIYHNHRPCLAEDRTVYSCVKTKLYFISTKMCQSICTIVRQCAFSVVISVICGTPYIYARQGVGGWRTGARHGVRGVTSPHTHSQPPHHSPTLEHSHSRLIFATPQAAGQGGGAGPRGPGRSLCAMLYPARRRRF